MPAEGLMLRVSKEEYCWCCSLVRGAGNWMEGIGFVRCSENGWGVGFALIFLCR